MSNERNYGIDMLRIVLMFMVCILHILGQGGILDVCEAGSLNYKVYWFLKIFAYCAVDGFAIISGYTAIDKQRKYSKLVEMWLQVFFYSFVVTLILTYAGFNNISIGELDIIRCAMPITFNKFWYFTAFFALSFVIPLLNKFIFSLDVEMSKKAFVIAFFLFSIMGVIGDPFRTLNGYSSIWLMILYCMGALAKKIRIFESRKNITLIVVWALCVIVSWILKVYYNMGMVVNYVSPAIVFSGISMVVLFSRIKVKGRIIAKLSPLVFGIYLFQLNQVVWGNVIRNAFAFVVQKDIVIGVLYVFKYALFIFVAGMVVEFLRCKIFKFIRIPAISEKIVNVIDTCLEKLTILLK